MGWTSIRSDCVLIKEKRGHTHTHTGGRPRHHRGTDRDDDSAGPGMAGEQPPQKGVRPATPGFGASGFQAVGDPTSVGLSPQRVALSRAAPEIYHRAQCRGQTLNKLTTGPVTMVVVSPRSGARTRRERAQPAKAPGRELGSCKEPIGADGPRGSEGAGVAPLSVQP